jgi:DNA-binding transcriptional regulator GbsR (MarR family)
MPDAEYERGPAPDLRASDDTETRYQDALNQFVTFWGEMASNWGINRTMAQIHALLYCAEEPLDTDQIMEQLDISRGNANMNLRSLIDWGLIDKVRRSGSRKDFYEAEKDVWTITARIIREREHREVSPVREQLQTCRETLTDGREDVEHCDDLDERGEHLCRRIDNLIGVMDVFNGLSRTLLPFVQQRNIEQVKQFIQFAEALQEQMPQKATERRQDEETENGSNVQAP